METLTKTSLALLIVLATGTLDMARADSNKPYVLFSVMDPRSVRLYSGARKNIKFLIEPFAYVSNGKLQNFPDNIGQKLFEFERDYYANHRQYTLFTGGKPSGSVGVRQNAFDIQCWSMAAVGDVTPPELVSGMRMGWRPMPTSKRCNTPDIRPQMMKGQLRSN